jgi:benzoyl-CoA reductase/2-hydroxyglutaryl-CoA dehydratase subunit BcrC/BadD/HgdB
MKKRNGKTEPMERNKESAKPESLSHFEGLSEACLAELESAKDDGTTVAGVYCVFAPTELIRAAGAIPVSLCGKRQDPIPHAEQTLPANLCPLIKSSYGYAITDTCPFFSYTDFVIAETTCDGKKKMFELLSRIKPLHLMQLPYTPDQENALGYWFSEIMRLKEFLERRTGNEIREEEVRRQIRLQNEIRLLFKRIMGHFRGRHAPVSGLDMLSVFGSKGFFTETETYLRLLARFLEELEEMERIGKTECKRGAPRILLTGTPAGKGSEKVLRVIEESGAIVVCQESCSGIKTITSLVDEEEEDPYLAIAKAYLQIPCPCMSPNRRRLELIGGFVKEYNIQGVVDLTWHGCHTYNIESYSLREYLVEKAGVPMLHIETDYSESDTEQLRTRIEAFLEVLDDREDAPNFERGVSNL